MDLSLLQPSLSCLIWALIFKWGLLDLLNISFWHRLHVSIILSTSLSLLPLHNLAVDFVCIISDCCTSHVFSILVTTLRRPIICLILFHFSSASRCSSWFVECLPLNLPQTWICSDLSLKNSVWICSVRLVFAIVLANSFYVRHRFNPICKQVGQECFASINLWASRSTKFATTLLFSSFFASTIQHSSILFGDLFRIVHGRRRWYRFIWKGSLAGVR